MHIQMVGRYTGLTIVMEFAPGNPLSGTFQVTIGHHNDRILSTQFQGHRGKLFGCCTHDNPPHVRTPCKEYLVKFLFKQFGGFIHSPLYYVQQFLWEIGIDHLRQGCR